MKVKFNIAICIFALGFSLSSCGGGDQKKAEKQLVMAQEAFTAGEFNEAKMLIDSIKILYPKAFDARREGIQLMQQVELAEQTQSLAFLDSMMTIKNEELAAIIKNYTLEKDTAYQKVGNYFWPTQTVEKNTERSFLRFQVNEQGLMKMTSIYNGGKGIHHFAVKVTAPDGTFAETPMSKDYYETTNLGRVLEQCDFKAGEDGNVIGFINFNKDNNLKVEFIGDSKYNTTMSADDRKAAAGVYELSQILSTMSNLKKEQEEANQKIQFVNRKIQERELKESTEIAK